MRPTDLLILPVAALWQQKTRTLLTTLGVVFGAFVLAASLSIGQGVQETIDRESRRSDVSRRVDVSPRWNPVPSKVESAEVKVEGRMTEARRDRLRKSLAEERLQATAGQARSELTKQRLDQIAAIPHVVRTIPMAYNLGFALLGEKSESARVLSVRPDDEARRKRMVAGRYFDTPDEHAVVVSEFLAYRLGLKDEAAVEGLVGKSLRLEFRGQRFESGFNLYIMKPRQSVSREERAALDKVMVRLPGALEKLDLTKPEVDALRAALKSEPVAEPEVYTEEFTVVGVIRGSTDEEMKEMNKSWDPSSVDTDILVPYRTGTDLFFRGSGRAELGMDQAALLVDEEKNVKGVVKQVETLGVDARAAIEFIERERLIYLLIFGGMTCVAGVALLVSALGIANTMLMSVLERTREIGIMKAVGADNRHLQVIFLVEGALIGLIGAVVGLLLAWAASFPADSWVRSMVMRDIKIDLKGSIFVFPTWIALTVLVFTVLVTTLAALYPARHASRIDPVSALRHE